MAIDRHLIKRMSYMSSYARQVVLARYALRTAGDIISLHPNVAVDVRRRAVLAAFRLAIMVLARPKPEAADMTAPVYPYAMPIRLKLEHRKSDTLFSIGGFPGKLDVIFSDAFSGIGETPSADRVHHAGYALEDEVRKLLKGASIVESELVDQRAIWLRSNPLWLSNKGEDFLDRTLPLLGELSGQDNVFRFWRDWYQGFLDGKPLDWELQRRVALIPNEDWEKGPEHIAEMIEEIKADYLAEKLPQAETVEFDEAEGKFFTVPVPVAKPDLLGATLSQLEDALDDALANPSNGLSERSRETRVLRRMAAKYGNDPQRIEMDLTSVHAGLTRQIVSGELPPSEENIALQTACEEGARGIRGTHPEIAENRRILSEQALRELSAEEKATLDEALPVLAAISRDDLAEEWAQDIPALINDALGPVPNTAPRLPGADEATRIFSRAAKISIWLRMGKVIHAIDGHAGYKAARIVTTIASLVTIGLAIHTLF